MDRGIGTTIILALLLAIPAVLFHPVSGAGEAYSLTPLPSRIQETDSRGVTLSLSVTGATTGQVYSFVWFVRDPAGGNRSATRSTVPSSSSFLLSVNYPSDFTGGARIQYVGAYPVSVAQTVPSILLAAVAQFEAGLTDAMSYKRTSTVSIAASGYQSDENVTVNMRLGASSVQGFPRHVLADSNGNIVDSWQTAPSTQVGNYTVTLVGPDTPKNPPDAQTFTLNPADVAITSILMPTSSLQRTETAEFAFAATYPNGDPAGTGSGVLRVAEPDQQTFHFVVAGWNSSRSLFVGAFRVPLNSQAGTWVATIDPGVFDDGFGNTGPTTSPLRGFNVSPATLGVLVSIVNGTYTVGETLFVYATITNPDGSSYDTGNVTARFSLAGHPVGSQTQLSYDTSLARWVGSYTFGENDQSGAWLVQVTASDFLGNGGQGSKSFLVSVPAQQSPLTSWWFFPLIAALAALIIGLFFFKKKRILRRELKVDLQAIGVEAHRVMSQDFFRSIQEQLGEKKKDPAKETGSV